MSDIDILSIDKEIQNKFQSKHKNYNSFKKKLEDLEECKKKEDIHSKIYKTIEASCEVLRKEIHEIETNQTLNFYISESSHVLDEYKNILKIPLKMSFVGKPIKNDKEKQKIIDKYIEIAKKYTEINLEKVKTPENKKNKVICENCGNKKEFDIMDGDTYVCLECFSQQVILKHTSSYKDCDRINISVKYCYDRRIHFRDCINQYQGKQNSTIDSKIYEDLEKQFENHYLLCGDKSSPKEVRFKNITKEHIMLFLKDLGYTKHYENVNLIHYTITGKKPDDISHLEDKLIQDFDKLTETYDRLFKNIERKNFINTAYLLHMLLKRHKHPCKEEDFSILKTVDRKTFHDDVCKILFEHNGFNFNSSF
jgi:hypothetical protein